MITRMPAARHSRTAAGTVGRRGSARPTRPRNSNGKSRGVSGRTKPAGTCTRNGEHAHALLRHFINGAAQLGPIPFRQLTEPGNCFWSAFRGNDKPGKVALIVHMGDGEKIRPQPVFPFESEVAVHRLTPRHVFGTEGEKRLLHRIERPTRAGENFVF